MLSAVSPGSAQDNAASAPRSHPRIFDRVEEFRLDNGMLFLLLPRHDDGGGPAVEVELRTFGD